MAKFVCTVCGYVFEGEAAPEFCPVCKAPASKFTKQEENMTWAAEHVVGVAQGVSEDILADLRAKLPGRVQRGRHVTSQWQELHTARATRKSAFTGRRPLTKKQSTLQSSQSCSAKL